MTITVVTGTPGAGKTLYSIEKLILPEIGKKIKGVDDDGKPYEVERRIFTNINGLTLEHDLIDGGGSWEVDKEDKWGYKGNEGGLRNWHQWAPKGAIIVFDEVQKVWPLAPNGSKIPPDLQGLDTHRHMGVDFILITQTVNNIHRHIYGLVGRHLHVRRIANMKMAIVYEWDQISRSLQYSKAIAKSPWRYSSKIFKLYKSSELHTKVKRTTPPLIWAVLLGLGLAGWGIPTYIQRMKDRTQGAVNVVEAKSPLPPPERAPSSIDLPPDPVDPLPQFQPVHSQQAQVEMPKIAGCISTATRCLCTDSFGTPVEPEPGFCDATTRKPNVLLAGGNVDWYVEPPPPPPPPEWTGSVVGTQKGWHF